MDSKQQSGNKRLPQDAVLTSLQIKNFKGIEDSGRVEFKPLTILTGKNSSGKSSIMEALALLAQATRLAGPLVTDSRPLPSVLQYGEFVSFPSNWAEYLTYGKDPNRSISFEVHARPSKASLQRLGPLGEKRSIGYAYSYNAFTQECSSSVFLEDSKVIEVTKSKTGSSSYQTLMRWEGDTPRVPSDLVRGIPSVSSPESILDPRCFDLPSSLPGHENVTHFALTTSQLAKAIVTDMHDYLSRTYLISALRGRVEPGITLRVPTHGAPPTWVGEDGRYLMQILSLCFSRGEHSAKSEDINEWSKRFGLGKITAGWRGGDRLGSDFEDPDLRTHLELALASGGSRQILSIITQIFWSSPGDVIMIEEPEISLHPESQVLVQDLFATAVKEGKQVICSTHSPFLILALSKVIRNERLSRDEVAIYHVDKRAKESKVKPLQLDQNGFVTGWIPSYLKIEDELFDEWAESIEKA